MIRHKNARATTEPITKTTIIKRACQGFIIPPPYSVLTVAQWEPKERKELAAYKDVGGTFQAIKGAG